MDSIQCASASVRYRRTLIFGFWFCLFRLRSVYAKKTGKRDSSGGGEDGQALGTPTAGRKRKRKDVDSEEDEDEDEDSDDEVDDEDEEEAGGKRGKKADACEEEVSEE